MALSKCCVESVLFGVFVIMFTFLYALFFRFFFFFFTLRLMYKSIASSIVQIVLEIIRIICVLKLFIKFRVCDDIRSFIFKLFWLFGRLLFEMKKSMPASLTIVLFLISSFVNASNYPFVMSEVLFFNIL